VDSPAYRARVFVTTYEELHGQDERFVGDIIERFCGTRPPQINLPVKDMSSHFRSGRRDEWREVFSAEQIERATAAIGPRLRERFGWND
jgi:hypothetical protein